jgi:hypothetical protein
MHTTLHSAHSPGIDAEVAADYWRRHDAPTFASIIAFSNHAFWPAQTISGHFLDYLYYA